MEDTAFIERLSLFGLSRQEAVIYLCLLKNPELTGYEVAKLTGISRSNVYNGLAALVEHGAAYVLEGASTKYTPVSIEEFCDNRIRYLKDTEEFLLRNSPKKHREAEGYITIEGYGHICDKIHHMLLGAAQRIYFSASRMFLEQWQEEFLELTQRRIKVVLIADELPLAFKKNSHLWEKIIFYQSGAGAEGKDIFEERERQLRLIIDSTYVLTGEVTGDGGTCLYSAQKNFVNVFKEAMRNEIELINIKKAKNS